MFVGSVYWVRVFPLLFRTASCPSDVDLLDVLICCYISRLIVLLELLCLCPFSMLCAVDINKKYERKERWWLGLVFGDWWRKDYTIPFISTVEIGQLRPALWLWLLFVKVSFMYMVLYALESVKRIVRFARWYGCTYVVLCCPLLAAAASLVHEHIAFSHSFIPWCTRSHINVFSTGWLIYVNEAKQCVNIGPRNRSSSLCPFPGHFPSASLLQAPSCFYYQLLAYCIFSSLVRLGHSLVVERHTNSHLHRYTLRIYFEFVAYSLHTAYRMISAFPSPLLISFIRRPTVAWTISILLIDLHSFFSCARLPLVMTRRWSLSVPVCCNPQPHTPPIPRRSLRIYRCLCFCLRCSFGLLFHLWLLHSLAVLLLLGDIAFFYFHLIKPLLIHWPRAYFYLQSPLPFVVGFFCLSSFFLFLSHAYIPVLSQTVATMNDCDHWLVGWLCIGFIFLFGSM